MNKPSRAWPFIKLLAKLVCGFGEKALPGSSAGVQFLIDMQDDLAKSGDETQKGIKEALQEIRANTADVRQRLAAEQLNVTDEQLRTAAKEVAEALYLKRVADDYVYADFKGIEQQERIASLKLDEIFVDLKAVAERSTNDSTTFDRLDRRLIASPKTLHEDLEQFATTIGDRKTIILTIDTGGTIWDDTDDASVSEIESFKDTRSSPQSIDKILSRSGGTVLMGGPGSGKTTLVKRLARSCALGSDELKQRYPQLSWCFPIVLPITTFQTERGERDLFRFLRDRLIELGGETLDEVFVERWAAGQCLVLLDGLDEVADVAGRIAAARGVDELLQTGNGNRVVVTTRPVGYNITRLSVPAEHFLLEPFSPQDIATFVRQWYLAHDRAMRPETPNPQQAEADAQSLIDDVQKNPGVGTLATNPLMLTIIALIKHQNVVLPERRVELYEIALNTLLRSWNRARSLSKRPVGEEPKLEKTKKVWAAVAYWMHANISRTISEAKLHERLVEVLMQEFHEPPHQADDIATSYLEAAKDRSGLLEARGPSTFAFVHQTFQEYLAAIHLALPTRKAVEKILAHAQDPRWHEAIRLAAGYIVIHQTDYDTLRDLMNALLDDPDPLEPYLGTSLRLAAACLADEIGVRSGESDRVIVKLLDRLTGYCFEPLKRAILEIVPALRVVPGDGANATLCQAASSEDSEVVRASAPLLARISTPRGEALQTLQRLFETEINPNIRAHVAWGLWHSGLMQDRKVALAVADGVWSGSEDMKLGPPPTLVRLLFELLKDPDSAIRVLVAAVLGCWGYEVQALPVLVELLNDSNHVVRSRAATALEGCEPLAEAVPMLVELLGHSDNDVQFFAAEILRGWGHLARALPELMKLLNNPNGEIRRRAAELLRGSDHEAVATSVLIELLNDSNSDVQLRAAKVLGSWGHQTLAVPVLVDTLKEKDSDRPAAHYAADILHGWGHQAQAVPILIELLSNPDCHVQARAAWVLGKWEPQPQAVPILIELLRNPDSNVCCFASTALAMWGTQSQATPMLIELLRDRDSFARYLAVEILDRWNPQAEAIPLLVGFLNDPHKIGRFRAASVLVGWGHQDHAAEVLVELLKSRDVRPLVANKLGGWGKDEVVVRAVAPKLYRSKTEAELVVRFLIDAAHGGPKQRSAKINQLLAKGLKPNGRDSDERRALRQILFRWTWDALATTA